METVELAYEELGKGNSIPLVILHGFFASSRNWRKIAETLADDFHVYVLDMRNHGRSPHHAVMDYPSMAADVLQFMDRHQITTAHILGHSMGGKIAMWLVLNHPERLLKLVIGDIAPKSYQHSFDKLIQALLDLPLDEIVNRKQAENLLADAIPELDYRQFLLQNMVLQNGAYQWRIDLKIFKAAAKNIVAFPGTQNLMPYVGQTLFVKGENSAFVTISDAMALFPNASFKTVANAGHWLHTQQPDLFGEVVAKFLR